MRLLGVSAYYHDSAAALVVDGHVLAAVQEERFTRVKHDPAFPRAAIDYCLSSAQLKLSDIDHVVFYDKPFLKFERLLETYLAFAPQGYRSFARAMPIWLRDKLFLRQLLTSELRKSEPGFHESRLLFSEHHMSHAASAFYPSPFSEAAILTLDGVGEWATTSLAVGSGRRIDIIKEIHFPHSLGLLYSAFTYHAGFRVNSGEYKLMGLAPYGEPRFAGKIRDQLIDIKPDGSFRLNMRYFDYCTGLTMTNRAFSDLFGVAPRQPDSPIEQIHMDLAASIQRVTEEVVLKLARSAAAETGKKYLCLAGGVALNCVANGKLLREACFEDIWIQPAAGDAGGAVGAALAAYHLHFGAERVDFVGRDGMSGAYLGPAFEQKEIEERLREIGAIYDIEDDGRLLDQCAGDLASGKAVGWFQGRMEYGPRALGNRSILADPRSPSMQRLLNLKVKYRESFRPFAPSVLSEAVSEWFDLDRDSPYMLLVANIANSKRKMMTEEQERLFGIDKLNIPRSDLPAITHVDYSARIQTVHADTNPRYHALLGRFASLTNCPVLVNTSFNVRGEPIVCTPEDAFRCFMGTDIETLAIGNCLLRKHRQNPALLADYQHAFKPD